MFYDLSFLIRNILRLLLSAQLGYWNSKEVTLIIFVYSILSFKILFYNVK